MNPKEFIGLEEANINNAKEFEQLVKEAQEESEEEITPESIQRNISLNQPPIPKVVNIVACVDYGCKLDLLKITSSTRNSEYNPIRFPAATLRNKEPKATALAFKNGKVNIVGCKSADIALKAARCFGRLFKNIGIKDVKIKSFSIANMVATMDCKFPIHLESIASSPGHIKFATYNPEIYAGLIYRLASPKTTLMIYVSGKIIITGAKSEEELKAASAFIYPILRLFASTEPPAA
ncbi:hypothetical protein TVAG_291560 [Trichomonas vaginalis G3]|uniref:TATA-box-binding protein n=1 Tax=Trichomonas vaginalis (strain ATCC PRA-98 / G3) TaxID=412133 RepID=A2DQT7_TRIV3|nr:DNA-templated transcription, initiation [Trichomonas vaginalis G3]EAY17204.1 hypothetical protein TVAG_291560 [Trichomonas vaginalis G3]KAI5486263.1 DNA-templated transcription, initiation [Trichomonas vaginalis G3]|eukprot:XP_001329427.1 hypothetical protein [Trichomonas vaginalis G3]